ncbi:hypothetical protein Nepgr_029754 [Nepenthes gracilis]|uniref:Uncharacterized protein n=1 Tax=Nepenthes gracilis TaxID=150966 RepID=A0AAD3TEW5_NEPGR|nr:hypothetical protein Nepgr_029754 [Nepenthes gracilis]
MEHIPELEVSSTVFDEITVELIENDEIEEESPLHWPHGIVEGKGLGRKREERETHPIPSKRGKMRLLRARIGWIYSGKCLKKSHQMRESRERRKRSGWQANVAFQA